MAKTKAEKLADELEVVMDEIAAMEAAIAPKKEREEQIRAELMQDMVKHGWQFVKSKTGLAFGLVSGRVSYKVKKGMEHAAIQWALKEFPGILKIGAADLNKVVQPMLNVPDFIERTQGEPHLAVRTQE